MNNKPKNPLLILTVIFLVFVCLAVFKIYTLTLENIDLKKAIVAQHRIIPDLLTDIPKTERNGFPQKNFIWPNSQKAVVSLAYDDGLPSHYEYVAPLLNRFNLKASFYPIGTEVMKNPTEWGKLAENGHELGNHSLFHPCRRPNINPAYHLANYNIQRWSDEMQTANFILKSIDGKNERTFAIPCAQSLIGPEDFQISIKPLFQKLCVAARSYADGKIIVAQDLQFYPLPSFAADLEMKTFDRILSEIEKAKQMSGWVIFTFHGFNKEEHRMIFDRQEHEKLIAYLFENKKLIWTSPIIEVCRYLKSVK